MLIRKLEPADAQAASDLVRRGFRDYVAPEWQAQAAQAFVTTELTPEPMGSLIAHCAFGAGAFGEENELLGLVILQNPTWLTVLFVAPDAFRRGIARELWNRTREFAESLSPPVVAVNLSASTFAIGFYRKAGFEVRGVIDHDGRHATRMTWQVARKETP